MFQTSHNNEYVQFLVFPITEEWLNPTSSLHSGIIVPFLLHNIPHTYSFVNKNKLEFKVLKSYEKCAINNLEIFGIKRYSTNLNHKEILQHSQIFYPCWMNLNNKNYLLYEKTHVTPKKPKKIEKNLLFETPIVEKNKMGDNDHIFVALLEDIYPGAIDLLQIGQTAQDLFYKFELFIKNPINKYTTANAWKDLQVLTWLTSGGLEPIKYCKVFGVHVNVNDNGKLKLLLHHTNNEVYDMMLGLNITKNDNYSFEYNIHLIHNEIIKDPFWKY